MEESIMKHCKTILQSALSIGTGPHACIEKENNKTFVIINIINSNNNDNNSIVVVVTAMATATVTVLMMFIKLLA